MWACIDRLPEPRDYLQVFKLYPVGTMQGIAHTTEQPKYSMVYLLPADTPINEKIYVIDDDAHSTMILANEY